jgi:hypothetical protein
MKDLNQVGAQSNSTLDGSVLRNIVFGVWFIALIAAPVFGRYGLAIAILGVGALLWSERKRWKRRVVARRQLEGWTKTPIRWEAPYVIQDDERGKRIGVIDTREHYTVRWEYFDSKRALYSITQHSGEIFVSSLATNAKTILVDALHVANYPCLEWPNLDL